MKNSTVKRSTLNLCKCLSLLWIGLTAQAVLADCDPLLKPTVDQSKIVIENNGTLVDLTTGLMWQRCALGYAWKNNTCIANEGAPALFTWDQALTLAAQNKSFAGFNDWRLPNKNELGSLVDYACSQPALDIKLFPETRAAGYWTNTPNSFIEARAWAVNFAHGDHMSSSRTDLLSARLVREVPR